MKITREEVEYVAHLARLTFSDDEMETFTSQLNDILVYMDTLKEVDTTSLPPLSHSVSLTNAFREDRVGDSLTPEDALANAPESRGGCFVVPRVVE